MLYDYYSSTPFRLLNTSRMIDYYSENKTVRPRNHSNADSKRSEEASHVRTLTVCEPLCSAPCSLLVSRDGNNVSGLQ